MKYKFPKTVQACSRSELLLWDIGDALLDEVGPPPGQGGSDNQPALHEVIEELEDAGLDTDAFSLGYLGKLRRVAFAFPPRKRHAKFSFAVHDEAETPEILEQILKSASDSKKITKRFVRAVVQRQREKAERQHQEELERHRVEKAAALKALHEAEERKRKARTQADREAALRAVKAARERNRDIPTPPPRPNYDAVEPPTKDDVMIVDLGIMADTSGAIALGKKVLAAVNERMEDFGMDDITMNAFVEGALECANVWREVANVARKLRVDKRGHITAVK